MSIQPIQSTYFCEPNCIHSEAFMFQKCFEDLRMRSRLRAEEISVVESKSVMWNNSGIGDPNVRIAFQVMTPGYFFIFQGPQRQYEYHTSLYHFVFIDR